MLFILVAYAIHYHYELVSIGRVFIDGVKYMLVANMTSPLLLFFTRAVRLYRPDTAGSLVVVLCQASIHRCGSLVPTGSGPPAGHSRMHTYVRTYTRTGI